MLAIRRKRGRVRGRRRISRKSKQIKTCTYCNKSYTGQAHKFCSVECRYQSTLKNTSRKVREKVRERHAKKPKKNCLSCGIVLETTVRNYHQLERCPPCQESQNKLRAKNFYEENKEEQLAYFKERHATRMQDPEYREIVRLRSIENRAKQPKTFVDCLVCGKNFQRNRYNRNCSKKCSEEWLEIKRKQPANLIRSRMGGQVRKALKYRGQTKNNKTFTLLGYTKYELKDHLESQFTDGMSWDRFNEIHIDHIRPVSSFNYTTTECEDFKKCWALNNLQPLWAKDNLSKGDKWDGITNA